MNLTSIEKNLINCFQKAFPICERPYLMIAEKLHISEEEVLKNLKSLKDKDVLSRVGPVFSPNTVGASCLAALKVPEHQLEDIANRINLLDSINHNYEREHEYNLWFVITAKNSSALEIEIDKIEELSDLKVLVLPLLREFFIDLGFEIAWSEDEV